MKTDGEGIEKWAMGILRPRVEARVEEYKEAGVPEPVAWRIVEHEMRKRFENGNTRRY